MKKKFIALLLSGALLVSAAVWPASAASVEQFTDVDSGDWFYTHVDYVAENGLLNGTSQTTFGPEASMTRGMFVTVLGNMTGIDTGLYPGTRFDDVPASEYYASRINWATENGIVSGLGGGKFGPNNSVTREQAATMLYNYAKRTGNDTSYSASVYNSFPDTSAVSSYAVEPLKWATSRGIINGSDGKLNPQGTATRAQIAAILHNAENKNKLDRGSTSSMKQAVTAEANLQDVAALIASIVHYGEYTIGQLKQYMADRGVPVRLTW